jgi:DNA-binding transcriptional ArsR family regulator
VLDQRVDVRRAGGEDRQNYLLTKSITSYNVIVEFIVKPKSCPPKTALADRPLMSCDQALQVEAIFEVLANDTRLRLLHEIVRRDEVCVGDLADALEMKPQAISNQLQRLADKGIVAGRREGNSILYRIVDNCITILLERGLCLMEETRQRKD